MTGYIASFTVYTLAMIGIIFVAYIVAKKSLLTGNFRRQKDNFLSVQETLNIGPRKSLLVVKAGDEKFLISSDAERTSFLTRLGEKQVQIVEKQSSSTVEDIINSRSYKDEKRQASVMKKILEKI